MRAAVIGAGLGGLLSANFLAEKGFKVDIYEKLPFYGGRFTNISYRGFQLSTGALHMIPHGNRGPLAQLLRKLNADVEIVDSKPEGEALYGGERLIIRKRNFPLRSKLKFFKWYFKNRIAGNDVSLKEFEAELDDFTRKFLRAFLGWSLSITTEDISFSHILPIYRHTIKHRGPGIPVGGCKGVVDALVENIKSYDGSIHLRTKVKGISKEGDRLCLITKEKNYYDIVFSNIGHLGTAKLLRDREYENRVSNLEPSSGIKYTIAIDEPFIGHTGVLFTLDTERISGMNEVTNADPNLAPNGKHLLMAHQPVITNNLRYEISLGLKDIKELLKGYNYEILAIQSYSGEWPVNRVRTGMDIGNETPYENLYVVGDGAKGDDIEVDGIALGVMRVISKL